MSSRFRSHLRNKTKLTEQKSGNVYVSTVTIRCVCVCLCVQCTIQAMAKRTLRLFYILKRASRRFANFSFSTWHTLCKYTEISAKEFWDRNAQHDTAWSSPKQRTPFVGCQKVQGRKAGEKKGWGKMVGESQLGDPYYSGGSGVEQTKQSVCVCAALMNIPLTQPGHSPFSPESWKLYKHPPTNT